MIPTGAHFSFNDLRTTKDLRFGSGTREFVFENQYEKPQFEVRVVGVMMNYDQNIAKNIDKWVFQPPPHFCCFVTPTGPNLSFNDLRTTKDLRFGSGTSGFVFENQYEKPRFEVRVVGVMMSFDQNIKKR